VLSFTSCSKAGRYPQAAFIVLCWLLAQGNGWKSRHAGYVPVKQNHSSVVASHADGATWSIVEQIDNFLKCHRDRVHKQTSKEASLHAKITRYGKITRYSSPYTGFEGKAMWMTRRHAFTPNSLKDIWCWEPRPQHYRRLDS
jgi:hypothetical protein